MSSAELWRGFGSGESGEPEELLKKYNMKAIDIASAARRVVKRK